MTRIDLLSPLFIATFVLATVAHAASIAPTDWPAWRGPTRDGIAAPGQNPPTEWSETQNILWKVPLPGRGHSSPTVVGERIYLATADPVKRAQSVLCLDRKTGKLVWQTEVHAANAESGKHANSTAASSTVACDGERLFINFLNGGAVHTSALDLSGKLLWQRKVCDFVAHQGFASSPVLHAGLVLVAADHRGGGVVTGLSQKLASPLEREPTESGELHHAGHLAGGGPHTSRAGGREPAHQPRPAHGQEALGN